MSVRFHPEFPKDQRRFEAQYREISEGLKVRFREAVDQAVTAIKADPSSAGHFVNTGAEVVTGFRRRNLRAFPFLCLSLPHWCKRRESKSV